MYNTFIYQPIFNLLLFIYQNFVFEDLGVAIVILTVLVRLLLFPLFHKSVKGQMIMQKLQPEVVKIKNNHKNNKEKQTLALLQLYKRHGVNPLGNLLILIIQLPILIALYQVFVSGLSEAAFPNVYFLNLIDLKNRSIVMVGLAAVAQYFQSRQLQIRSSGQEGKKEPAEQVNQIMIWLAPVLTFALLLSLPAAVGLYWLVTTIFSIGHQYFIVKSLNGKYNGKN